jgi:hypothetical protein
MSFGGRDNFVGFRLPVYCTLPAWDNSYTTRPQSYLIDSLASCLILDDHLQRAY